MPTTSQDATAKQARQSRTPDVPSAEGSREGTNKRDDEPRETGAKQDKERSDWEGMAPRPEQGEDDVAAPGELPETD